MTNRLTRMVLTLAMLLAVALPAFAAPPPRPANKAMQNRIVAAERAQPKLLDAAFNALAAQRPGTRDLYFLGVAAFGDQNVFAKEVERVRALFDQRFGTAGRSLAIVNNPGTLTRYPLATPANLRTALAEIGKRIDRDEDVLFLFVTSHGAPEDGVVVRFNGRDLGSVTPRQLAEMLDAAGIRNRVIVVSACFSGQYVPALANEDTLVMTAAAADRPSFGCSTTAEWTWFGESYFKDALPKDGKFIPAFTRAREIVTAREKKARQRPSLPQISAGRKIRGVLDELGF